MPVLCWPNGIVYPPNGSSLDISDKGRLSRSLRAYALRPVKREAVNPLLHQVIRYREELEFTDKYVAKLPSLFGRFGRDEEWETINQIICEMSSLHSLLLSYSKDVAKTSRIKQNLALQLTEGIRHSKIFIPTPSMNCITLSEALTATEQQLPALWV